MWRILCCTVGIICAQACTIVEVEGGKVAPAIHLGVLRIEPAGAAKATVYRSRGLGLVPGRAGLTIGAADETVALVAAEDCRIILFQPRRAELEAMLTTLAAAKASPDTVCILGEKTK